MKRLLVCGLLAVLGCPNRAPAADADAGPKAPPVQSGHADEPEHEALPKTVRLPNDVVVAAKIEMAPATKEILAATLSLTGEVAVDPDRSARVSSPIPGRVEQVRVREGSTVKKGDIVVVVRVPELGKVRAAAVAATARAVAARANATRLSALASKGLAANQEVATATAEADALEADARAAEEQLRAIGTGGSGGPELTIRSPISGVVVARDAVVGQPVTPDQIVASIADLSEVWFLARVFEKDLGRLHLDAPSEVQLNAYPGEHFDGRIDTIGRQIDPVARTLTARIRLTNRNDRLRIGLFGTAIVAVDDGQAKNAVLVVPRAALTEVGGKKVVFVREPDGDFAMHEVVLGDEGVGKVQILSGLRDGESVVVHGVFTLKSVVLKGTFGEEGE